MSFRIAVIGCGQIAFSQHGPAYQKYAALHPSTELTACCDVDSERAAAFAAKFGFTHFYSDWKSMLQKEQPDAVCLNVPPALTTDLACQVLRLGFPLLLEKPPGLNEKEINALMAAAAETGAPNQVAFNRRYLPLLVHLYNHLEQNISPAEVQHIHYDFCRIGRTDADFSTTAIHGIDAARFLARSEYATVHFHYCEMPAAGAHVANYLLDCTFQCGTTAHLSFLPLTGLVIERAEVHASGNSFFLKTPIWHGFDYPGSLVHIQHGQIVEELSGIDAAGGSEEFLLNGFYQEDAAFFDDIRAGRKPAADIRSGRQAVIIAQAIRERREWVKFD
jgi:myo-inositol 2-dehydrogenase / D-chiro-inositol 1-dehydrogenase